MVAVIGLIWLGMHIAANSYSCSILEFVAGASAIIGILFLVINIIAIPICRIDQRDTLLKMEAFKETVKDYKYKDGVYFLNLNTITRDEYREVLKYNTLVKQWHYWYDKPYTAVFYINDVAKAKPIRFIKEK